MTEPEDDIMRVWRETKEAMDREPEPRKAVLERTPKRMMGKSPLELANSQGTTWKQGLERFVRHNPQEVCDELTEMGIGTFARGILLAMEGPVCPMCHRGGEPWAYQTFAKVAKVIGDDTLQALALKTLGVSLEAITAAVKLYRSTEGATPEETDRLAQEWLRARNWTCIAPAHKVEVPSEGVG